MVLVYTRAHFWILFLTREDYRKQISAGSRLLTFTTMGEWL
jgi:hypothetical protein